MLITHLSGSVLHAYLHGMQSLFERSSWRLTTNLAFDTLNPHGKDGLFFLCAKFSGNTKIRKLLGHRS